MKILIDKGITLYYPFGMSKPGLRTLTVKLMRPEDVETLKSLETISGLNTSESVRQSIRHYEKYLRTRRNGKKAA
jgi:hypothetical protein